MLMEELKQGQKIGAPPTDAKKDKDGFLQVQDKLWVPPSLVKDVLELHHDA
jgi:hypothetical protein